MSKILVGGLSALLLHAEVNVDLFAINRIKAEAFQNSKVMENAFYLTDVYGPRLTGSPGLQASAEWAVKRMGEWGLSGGQLEKWNPFGRGWSCTRFSAQMKEPQFAPLIGFARPWSPGTNGPLSADPILAVMRRDEDLPKFKGKLRGKIVLLQEPARSVPASRILTRRLTDAGLVMLGAHLDSWTGGTGATDNAAGCAVAMEAIRILKTLDFKMPRTVRIGLWTGEEQGLLGSKAYVKEHFANPEDMKLKPEHAKLSGYFNLDNGTGKIRGVYLQEIDMMRPVFESWLTPFKDLGASTVTIRKTGGTDHLSFDAVGLPGFQFIQDPVEYSTRTHHSNMDLFDRLQAGDLMQASAIMASMVYMTAMREEKLPRKALPKATPKKKEENEIGKKAG